MTRDFIVDVMAYCVNRKVIAFENTHSALSYFNQGNTFDLLLVNLTLPDDSGYELLKRMKEQSPSTYLIAMSANPADQTPAESFGADIFLAKPFALKDLFKIVQHIIIDDEIIPTPPKPSPPDSQPPLPLPQ